MPQKEVGRSPLRALLGPVCRGWFRCNDKFVAWIAPSATETTAVALFGAVSLVCLQCKHRALGRRRGPWGRHLSRPPQPCPWFVTRNHQEDRRHRTRTPPGEWIRRKFHWPVPGGCLSGDLLQPARGADPVRTVKAILRQNVQSVLWGIIREFRKPPCQWNPGQSCTNNQTGQSEAPVQTLCPLSRRASRK